MIVSPELREFVAAWEALRTEAYDDGTGVWTIGYGHTDGVQPGDTCTRDEAERWLTDELAQTGNDLERYFTYRDPSPQQADALTSLAYNCGVKAIGESGLMARFNAGLDKECADRFLMWNKAGGRALPGLSRRRAAERAIYLYGDYTGRP